MGLYQPPVATIEDHHRHHKKTQGRNRKSGSSSVNGEINATCKDWLYPHTLQPKLRRTSIFKFTDITPLSAYSKQVQGYNLNAIDKVIDGLMEKVVDNGN